MSDKVNNDPPDPPQDFAVILMQHAGGRAHAEASRKLRDVVEAVIRTGKSGSVTVKLTLAKDKEFAMVKVDDAITASIPRESRRSLWFPDDDNTLHRDNPRQPSLFQSEQAEQVEKIQPPERTEY